MADISKYKLVGECKPQLKGCDLLVKTLSLDFACDVCGELITLLLTWEGSNKAEKQSNCRCQTLKINANRCSNSNKDDDIVAIVLVSGKFTIKKKELTGKDIQWQAVSEADGSSFTIDSDDNLNADRGVINIEPMDSAGMKLKRKHVEIQPTDAEDAEDDHEDDEPFLLPSAVKSNDHESYSDMSDDEVWDDYNLAKYIRSEADDYESGEEEYDPDNENTYNPLDYLLVKPDAKYGGCGSSSSKGLQKKRKHGGWMRARKKESK